ncbi:MAG: hypothetical protein WD740_07995 [Anaerolineales bacterium]
MSAFFGWLCLVWLLSAASEPASAVVLGYSLERLVLAAILFVSAAAFSSLALISWRDGFWLEKVNRLAKSIIVNGRNAWLIGGIGLSVLIVCWILFFLSPERTIMLLGSLSLYIERVKPLLLYALLLSLIWLPQLLFIRFGIDIKAVENERDTVRRSFAISVGLLSAAAVIGLAGLGLGFDATEWNAPNAPLLSGQIFINLLLVLLTLAAAFGLRSWMKGRSPYAEHRFDLALAGLVWFLAAVLWLGQPAAPTYYNSPALPPADQSYPLSDAFNHDVIANNVLIGEGFRFGGQVAIRRPAYVLFLAGLEGMLGADYAAVVTVQVILLALFPALLYLLGAKLHSRFTGLFLAGLIILRETNSIALGDVINTSHAKLLMVDLPAALMTAAVAFAVISWLSRPAHNPITAFLVGGLLGLAILLRSQNLTLLPFIVLLALLVWGWRAAWRPVLLFTLGALLVAAPWIVRNRVLIGQWVIEDAAVSGFLANRYSFTPGTFGLPFLQGENEGDYYARQMGHVREFALQNPGYVASFVADNFVRNQMVNFMAMPLSLQLRDAESHVRQLPYWPSWDGSLAFESYIPVLANILIIGVGLASAWKQARWVGLVPLFINIGFTSNLALARVSGWRYNLPVDWTMLFYYALGVGQLFVWGLLLLGGVRWAKNFLANLQPVKVKKTDRRVNESRVPIRNYAAVLIVLLFVGASFSIIEALSTSRYTDVTREQAAVLLTETETQNEAGKHQLLELLSAGKLGVFSGRALHPRYFAAGEGIPEREFVLITPLDFERLTFYLLGPDPASVILPVDGVPASFPASSNVFVFHCGDTLQAAAVIIVYEDKLARLIISNRLVEGCPSLISQTP